MYFEPIAIIGRACLLPGALTPKKLWECVINKKNLLSKIPNNYWRIDPKYVLKEYAENAQDYSWTEKGGYVKGFDSVFNPEGFEISVNEILNLDTLFQWVLHTSRDALIDAGYYERLINNSDLIAGAIFGNLSYPSHSLTEYSEAVWLDGQAKGFFGGNSAKLAKVKKPHPVNRFMSGLPAHMLAHALKLKNGAHAIDAACASSLYAIKLACNQLHDRKADIMLAGGVNRADDLIIHIGFCTLQAMSHTGQSRPFHKDANGLVPAEGAGFVVLKRLDDAIKDQDNIFGIIRAVGLSNDGRGSGLLVPSQKGQERAISKAYEMSGLSSEDISLVECHATGTPVGDEVEIRSLSNIFKKNVAIGSIKSNMGHPITVSGIAGLIKVMEAMRNEVIPPTINAEEPAEILKKSPLRLVTEPEPWTCNNKRYAAVNNFGFGGNNAHLIVEQYIPDSSVHYGQRASFKKEEIAIVGMGTIVADTLGVEEFAGSLFTGRSCLRKQSDGSLDGFSDPFELPITGLSFPPIDLDQTLAQQLMILKAAMEAVNEVNKLSQQMTGVFIGMGCDTEVSRSGFCWRLDKWIRDWTKPFAVSDEDLNIWVTKARNHIKPVRKAASIIGAMPNIAANRINCQLDFSGMGFTVSSEELSGIKSLDIAVRTLRAKELDAALVGAVDICCCPVHKSAARAVLENSKKIPGDAAIVLVLKRLSDARKDQDKVYAVISDDLETECDFSYGFNKGADLTPLFGHAHAASGLLHIAAAALSCRYSAFPSGHDMPVPWPCSDSPMTVKISIEAMKGAKSVTCLKKDMETISKPFIAESVPAIHVFSGENNKQVIESIKKGKESEKGTMRLVLVSSTPDELALLKKNAVNLIEKSNNLNNSIELADNIYYCKQSIKGKLAFVFADSAAYYQNMGKDLLLAFPELASTFFSNSSILKESLYKIYQNDINHQTNKRQINLVSSMIARVYTHITAYYLDLLPDSVIGFSLEENSTFFAAKALKDIEKISKDINIIISDYLDLPGTIEKAWDAGVRFFINLGPCDGTVDKIYQALGDKLCLAVSMDRKEIPLLKRIIQTAAQITAAGFPINYKKLISKFMSTKDKSEIAKMQKTPQNMYKTYPAHIPDIQLPKITFDKKNSSLTPSAPKNSEKKNSSGYIKPSCESQPMIAAPILPSVIEPESIQTPTKKNEEFFGKAESDITGIIKKMVDQNAYINSMHKNFISAQAEIQKNFLQLRQNALSILHKAAFTRNPATEPNIKKNIQPILKPYEEIQPPSEPEEIQPPSEPEEIQPPSEQKNPAVQQGHNNSSEQQTDKALPNKKIEKKPCGPSFSREQLEILASDKISSVFGHMFEKQDKYFRQVRMPEPPLLLVDRITGIDAEPGSMKTGTIWTETDVKADSWFLYDQRIPAGIMVESGQADLLLISYLGVDFINKSERIYRLLGCDLTYHNTLPRVGDTLCYDIHIDGHAKVGDVRLFFFHYDCKVNGKLHLSVRNAQAGFFTDKELDDSKGILWKPETGELKKEAKLDPPAVLCTRNKFTKEQVTAFSEGKVFKCFGKGFELSQTHTKTPKIQPGRMMLLEDVTCFDPKGGPWKRGYLCVENKISPDDWFLTCHFKNDPCMPGTLMCEGCLQAMSFYLTAMGFTLNKDGWRFDPVPDETYQLKCRGQVTPETKGIIYEVFIEEVICEPFPTIYADILGSADGMKIFHGRRMGLRLVPDWPLESSPDLFKNVKETKQVACAGDFKFDYKSLMAGALGKPSKAFGKLGRAFDKTRHIARLPGPPYHFMSRVTYLGTEIGSMKANTSIETEYDVCDSDWYFDENGNKTMPFCVLMEAALQPCGWMSVYVGCPGTSDNDLYFRNLDGTGNVLAEVFPGTKTLRIKVKLTNIARISGVILVNFDIECFAGKKIISTMQTGFGFFPKEALANQLGLPVTQEERKLIDEPCDFLVDLSKRPDKYCQGKLKLPGKKLLMIDKVTGYWPNGGKKGQGRLIAEKIVDLSEWFFKAHFFQDPVQPGSLGVEAMISLLQFYMLHKNMDNNIKQPRFEPLALSKTVTWKYRGQVTPSTKCIIVEMDIIETGCDENGPFAVAEAWLWADKLRIFNVKNIAMRIVSENHFTDDTVQDKNFDIKSQDEKNNLENIVKKQVSSCLKVQPSAIRFFDNCTKAVCSSMPLNIFPVKITDNKSIGPVVKIGEPSLDIKSIIDYSRNLLQIGHPWIGEDFARGFYTKFTRKIIVEDKTLKCLRKQNVLYLANHQVQIETVPFFTLLRVLTDTVTLTIANATHLTGWLAPFHDFIHSYPGINYPENIAYFDQNDQNSMFDILNIIKQKITDEGASFLLHVEGKLGLTCRDPLKSLSSVFIDMALDKKLPIVPVKFVGGLPVEKMNNTLDFPTGYAKQDYYIGSPIFPDELYSLPYVERKKIVLAAINGLGPLHNKEIPNSPDNKFLDEVNLWKEKAHVSEVKAVLFKMLENLSDPVSPETEALVNAAQKGYITINDDEKGHWLTGLARWIFEDDTFEIKYSNN